MANEVALTKNEIIGNLYSIRAGMSYIGNLADEYRANENTISKCYANIEKYKDNISSARRDINSQSNKTSNLYSDLTSKTDSLETTEKQLEQEKAKSFSNYSGDFKKYVTLSVISTTLAAAVIIGCIVLAILGLPEFILESLLPIIGISVWCFFANKNLIEEKRDVVEKKNNKIKELQLKIEKLQSSIQKLNYEIPNSQENTPKIIESLENEIQKTENKIASENTKISDLKNNNLTLSQESDAVYKGLVDTYGELFHPDNWVNLDRVVYYLSTGRAENIRDSLNLMDQRLNAELIANEIKASSNMIVSEIKSASEYTINAITTCADMLNTSLRHVELSVREGNVNLSKQLAYNTSVAASQVAATKRLISAQQLNNSLQAKSNQTMESLLNDYKVVNNRF